MKSFLEYFTLLENSVKRSYSCLMLDCEPLMKYVKEIQDNIDNDDVYDEKVGHGLEKEPHITVLYGIHEQSPDKVKKVLNLHPVKYKLTGLSFFENEEYDVLKCSVESEDLHSLNEEATEKLEYTSNFPDYKPHMTIAYLKPGSGTKYTGIKSKMFGEDLKSNVFIFSDQDGKQVKWNI